MVEGHAARLGDLHGDGDSVLRRGFAVAYWAEAAGNPIDSPPRRRRRQHGRQGIRFGVGSLRAVCDGDDRHVVRRRQRDARFVHAARRPGAARQHATRRDHLRRRGQRSLRHDHVRRADGLHRRTDGRTNAGVSRQEDRTPRGDSLRFLRFCDAGARARADGRRGARPEGTGDARQQRPARILRNSVRVHVDEREQRQRVRRTGPEPVLQRRDRREHVLRPLCRGRFPRLRSPARSPARKPSRRRRGHVHDLLADFRRAAHRHDSSSSARSRFFRPMRWARSSNICSICKERRSR